VTTNGLQLTSGFQRSDVDMKSANETQAEAPELNLKPMSALSPLHEWKKKEGR
jgi:hypothetical protein